MRRARIEERSLCGGILVAIPFAAMLLVASCGSPERKPEPPSTPIADRASFTRELGHELEGSFDLRFVDEEQGLVVSWPIPTAEEGLYLLLYVEVGAKEAPEATVPVASVVTARSTERGLEVVEPVEAARRLEQEVQERLDRWAVERSHAPSTAPRA